MNWNWSPKVWERFYHWDLVSLGPTHTVIDKAETEINANEKCFNDWTNSNWHYYFWNVLTQLDFIIIGTTLTVITKYRTVILINEKYFANLITLSQTQQTETVEKSI